MSPGVTLSTTPQVTIEARVSQSGSATPGAGDLGGKSAPVKPGARDVRVIIDRELP
jgi:cytochrome c-type biogenesis protein CcmH